MTIEHRLHARCRAAASSEAEAGGAGARPFAFASTTRHYERDRPFAIEHIDLDLDLDVEARSVSGEATLRVRRISPDAREIELDAVAFDVEEIRVGGKRAKYTYDGKTLAVELGDAAAAIVAVRYRATPRRGLYFLEPDPHYPARPRQVWSQCQEEDARHFVPCHDKPHVKMTTAISVVVPGSWYALSNGRLEERTEAKDGRARFRWRMDEPHASYLMTLVAGEFAEVREEADGVPLSYLVPRGREGDVARTFGRTPAMLRLFGELFGARYPWNKYAQVVVSDFIFGGMENTTATTLYEHVLLDERAALDVTSDDLVAHELAHQWFGDLVTCRDWSEGWLNEGFATYAEHLWRESSLGADEYHHGLAADLAAYLAEASGRYRRPVVCQDYDAPLDLFDRHLYEKGSLALHAIRTEVGAPTFYKGVALYVARHQRGLVETRDLLHAMEEVSGRSLGRLFDQTLQKPGHPELEVSLEWQRGALSVHVKQTQASTEGVPAAFDVPLDLDVSDGRGLRREQRRVSARQETFVVACDARPAFVVVDPDLRIVGDVVVRAPLGMLVAQIEKAPTGRARSLAARALGKHDGPEALRALRSRVADEDEFWGVRAEAAEVLGLSRTEAAEDALLAHAETRHPKVRRAVVHALGHYRTTRAFEALKKAALSDPSYLVAADAARAAGKTRQAGAMDLLLEIVDRPSWADVVSAGALDGLAELRDERAVPHLVVRTRYGHPTRARRAAILALPRIAQDRKTRELIEELLDDADPYLRIDAVRALVDLGDTRSRAPLKARLDRDLDARVRRRIREALRDLVEHGRRGQTEVSEKVDRLEGELVGLKGKVLELEARAKAPEKKLRPAASKRATPRARRRS